MSDTFLSRLATRFAPVSRERASAMAIRQLEELRSPKSSDDVSHQEWRLDGEAYRTRRWAILEDYTCFPRTARLELLLCLAAGIIPASAVVVGCLWKSGSAFLFGAATATAWIYYSSQHLRAYYLKRSLTKEMRRGVVEDLFAAGLVQPNEAKRLRRWIESGREPDPVPVAN